MALVFLGLGSNLGDGKANLDQALLLIGQQVGEVKAISSYIESEPWGFDSVYRFTNAVCAVETELEPMLLLDETQAIERKMGRTHKHQPGESYTDRIIDIDILTYDNLTLNNNRLTLPHPLIEEREFVYRPLNECKKLIKK